MPFPSPFSQLPSHLQGLNAAFPETTTGGFSDADLAETLALWTNVEFSFDDGGVGLSSGLKLVEEDERLAREAAAQQHQHQQWDAPSDPASHLEQQQAVGQQHQDGSLDPFGFNSTFFSLAPPASDVAPVVPKQEEQQQPGLTLETFDFSSLPGYPGAAPSAPSAASAVAGTKRKLSVSASARPSPGSVDEDVGSNKSPAALSAEEDKRRRNTEASARFRAKKKEREAALEKSARELQARTAALEKEVETLRRENTWLKGLVIAGEGIKTDKPTSA